MKRLLERLQAYLTAAAFAEEGDVETARGMVAEAIVADAIRGAIAPDVRRVPAAGRRGIESAKEPTVRRAPPRRPLAKGSGA